MEKRPRGRPRKKAEDKVETKTFALDCKSIEKLNAFSNKYDVGVSKALRLILKEVEI